MVTSICIASGLALGCGNELCISFFCCEEIKIIASFCIRSIRPCNL